MLVKLIVWPVPVIVPLELSPLMVRLACVLSTIVVLAAPVICTVPVNTDRSPIVSVSPPSKLTAKVPPSLSPVVWQGEHPGPLSAATPLLGGLARLGCCRVGEVVGAAPRQHRPQRVRDQVDYGR